MAIIAGIDEAGLGPVLGPLVVSTSVFRVADELADVPMWDVLRDSVSRKPSRRNTHIAFADSKKLYSSQNKRSLVHLERGVLTMLANIAGRAARGAGGTACPYGPTSLKGLLGAVSPACVKQLASYPWYDAGELALPCSLEATGVALSANALGVSLSRAGIEPLAMRAEVVLEGEFNRLIAATDNKSVTLFDVAARLLDYIRRLGDDNLVKITVDRQGGRMHYLPALGRLFEGGQFKIIDESETLSAYRITEGPRRIEICFLVGSEDQHLPVALASMLSKYIRELFMEMFNRFWRGRVPNIAPTSGYYVDGNRFYAEIQPHIRELGLDEAMFYRCR